MLIKRKSQDAARTRLAGLAGGLTSGVMDRRTFLARSGLTAAGAIAVGALTLGSVRRADAVSAPQPGVATTIKKNICTHCSVGCTVKAEVQNGVWTGQEPAWESPINRGTHCAKGASVREIVHGERRVKYPMKLAGGQMGAHVLGGCDQRDRRQACSSIRARIRPGFGLSGWGRPSSLE